MSLFGTIGKMASSKIFEKVEDGLKKKENCEQTSGYCKYIKANIDRIGKTIAELEIETKALIEQIQEKKGVKLSFREKSDLRKAKDKANKNLEYLYLARDFFTVLAKSASGLILKTDEFMLLNKFAPYFDGVPVLDIDEESSDDSLLGAFKEVGQELKETFVSSKKDPSHFDFDEYLCRYSEKIEEYILPDIDSAVQSFNNAMAVQETSFAPIADVPSAVPEDTECPNCHTKLAANAKFCPECGNKIEVKKPAFCTECGTPINPGSKFCSSCGAKIN